MDEQAHQIANKVISDTAFYTSIVSVIGVVLGSLLTILGNWITQRSSEGKETRRDEHRRKVLRTMLEDERFPNHWRKLDTLMHVIGADEATTTRMLLEIGARGSEDGQRLWGLIKHHPLSDIA